MNGVSTSGCRTKIYHEIVCSCARKGKAQPCKRESATRVSHDSVHKAHSTRTTNIWPVCGSSYSLCDQTSSISFVQNISTVRWCKSGENLLHEDALRDARRNMVARHCQNPQRIGQGPYHLSTTFCLSTGSPTMAEKHERVVETRPPGADPACTGAAAAPPAAA